MSPVLHTAAFFLRGAVPLGANISVGLGGDGPHPRYRDLCVRIVDPLEGVLVTLQYLWFKGTDGDVALANELVISFRNADRLHSK